MRKLIFLFTVFSLVAVVTMIPQSYAAASCEGASCRGDDPAVETDDEGRKCSATAYSVYGGYEATGSYGRLKNELRYSTGCIANWSRGTVLANNSSTKYLYAKVWEKYYPSWNYYYWITGNPLSVWSQCYTDMVSGTSTTISYVGIAYSAWSGPYNPSHQYEG